MATESKIFLIFIAVIFLQVLYGFEIIPRFLTKYNRLHSTIEDEVESESLEKIKSNYLTNKFQDCRGDDCRLEITIDEIKSLLQSIIPPVKASIVDKEMSQLLQKMPKSDSYSVEDFIPAVIKNSFWLEAGELVVKELIFLDCLHSYYYEKRNMLEDDDYNELKDNLTWEGSAAVTMSGKEAHFISAVAAHRRGQPILSDSDYEKLKSQLSNEGSWVVRRMQDPLEKLGLSTFLSYLHRSF